jgi:hypothetical protein
MRIVISACTNRAFSQGLMPMAQLRFGQMDAENDNGAHFQAARLSRSPSKRVESARPSYSGQRAYGGAGHVIAVFALVAGIVAMPLLQKLAEPIMTAREEGPKVFRGSPIAPALLQVQENG